VLYPLHSSKSEKSQDLTIWLHTTQPVPTSISFRKYLKLILLPTVIYDLINICWFIWCIEILNICDQFACDWQAITKVTASWDMRSLLLTQITVKLIETHFWQAAGEINTTQHNTNTHTRTHTMLFWQQNVEGTFRFVGYSSSLYRLHANLWYGSYKSNNQIKFSLQYCLSGSCAEFHWEFRIF